MEFKETIKLTCQKDNFGQIVDLRNYFLKNCKSLSAKEINQIARMLRISPKAIKKALRINKHTDTKGLYGYSQKRAKSQA